MSRKKKRNKNWQSSPTPPTPQSIPPSRLTGNLSFDEQEEKIRGEEIMLKEEARREKEAYEIKKKLDEVEVDRRLEELRRQLGLKK